MIWFFTSLTAVARSGCARSREPEQDIRSQRLHGAALPTDAAVEFAGILEQLRHADKIKTGIIGLDVFQRFDWPVIERLADFTGVGVDPVTTVDKLPSGFVVTDVEGQLYKLCVFRV